MGWRNHLIGLSKIGADIFGLPDFYTYSISKNYKNFSYHVLLYSLFADIVLDFPLGTFFLLDVISYIIWAIIKRFVYHSNLPIILYIVRYFFLYCLGVGSLHILNQICYCIFFMAIKIMIFGIP